MHSRGRPRKAPSKKQKLPSSEKTSKTSPQRRNNAIAQVWHAAYTDCRSSFGQATVGMSQAELRELFEALGAEPSTAFRLVPIDPCKELTTGNARLVRREVRIRALRAWSDAKKRCGKVLESDARDTYMAALQNAAADDASEVEGGQGQPGGLVRTEDSSDRQSGDLVGDAKEEYVEDGEGTDDECNDDDDNDDFGQVD